MKIEASKRTHVSAQKALTAAVETAIIIPEISEGDSRIRCPGVCASRLYFLLHFHNRSFESVRGCHAPVLGRQGTAEMRRRAPTYRERWVKNDDSGTLGFLFFQNQNAVQSGTAFSFYIIIDKKAAACKSRGHFITGWTHRRILRRSSRRRSSSCCRRERAKSPPRRPANRRTRGSLRRASGTPPWRADRRSRNPP